MATASQYADRVRRTKILNLEALRANRGLLDAKISKLSRQLGEAKEKAPRYPREALRAEVARRVQQEHRLPRICCDLAKADGRERCYYHDPNTWL